MLVSVFTVAMYTIFLAKQFLSNGHLFFSLQLHDASTFVCAAFNDFPIVVFDNIFYTFSATIT